MNATHLLKKATASHARYQKHLSEADQAHKERESLLSEAAFFSKKIGELVDICGMSSEKTTQAVAWKKAVFLLDATPKAYGDLMRLYACAFYPTQREADAAQALSAKQKLILVDLTIEQWDRVESQCTDYSVRQYATKKLEEIVKACEDLELFRQWKWLYERRSWWHYSLSRRFDELSQQA